MDHAIPPASVVSEVHAWLTEDLKRRREDRKKFPKLAVAADDTPNRAEQAKRLVWSAQDDFETPERTWRGVALLQGVTQRWGSTDSAKLAKRLLKNILSDKSLLDRIEVQGALDEVKSGTAQAEALERFGQTAQAIAAWELLAKNYEGTPTGVRAVGNIKRLRAKGT